MTRSVKGVTQASGKATSQVLWQQPVGIATRSSPLCKCKSELTASQLDNPHEGVYGGGIT